MCVFGSSVRMQVCFLLLLIQLHVTEGCRLEGAGETKPITAYTGDSVLLSCSCTDLHTTSETLTWTKYTNENKWVEISPESEQYKGRVQMVNDHSSGNLSLLISHLTKEDDGSYRCSVKGGEYRDFRLTVEGCTLNQQTGSVTGYVGQSVLLPCSCFQLQAKPHTLRWIFLKGSHKEIFPEDQTNRYADRVQLFNDHHPGNLSLLISHLTVEDGGWYRCQINNNDYKDVSVTVKATTRRPPTLTPKTKATSTPVLVDVTPTKPTLVVDDKMNTHSEKSGKDDKSEMIIISSGVVVVLLLLLILGGVMYWKRKGPRQRQPKIVEGQTGPSTQQKEQDFTEPLHLTVTSEPMYEAVDRQNDSEILYASILKKPKHKEADEKQDDVTYSTLVHSNTVRAAHTPVEPEDTPLYASIKTK